MLIGYRVRLGGLRIEQKWNQVKVDFFGHKSTRKKRPYSLDTNPQKSVSRGNVNMVTAYYMEDIQGKSGNH